MGNYYQVISEYYDFIANEESDELDENGEPQIITDSDDMTIQKNNRIIDHYEEYINGSYDEFFGGPYEEYTVYSIADDGYTPDMKDYYSMESTDDNDGFMYYHNGEEVTEKEYRAKQDEFDEATGIDLEWTKLKSKSNTWE